MINIILETPAEENAIVFSIDDSKLDLLLFYAKYYGVEITFTHSLDAGKVL